MGQRLLSGQCQEPWVNTAFYSNNVMAGDFTATLSAGFGQTGFESVSIAQSSVIPGPRSSALIRHILHQPPVIKNHVRPIRQSFEFPISATSLIITQMSI